MDKLDKLFDLLKVKNPNKYEDEDDKIFRLLFNLEKDSEAFLFIYESFSEEQKIKVEQIFGFKDKLFSVIRTLDDNIFNHYFFTKLVDNTNFNLVRDEAFKRNQNEKLKAHVMNKEEPKNIDKVISSLSVYYEKEEFKNKYENLVNKYRSDIFSVNNITSSKSRSVKYLLNWLVLILTKKSMNDVINICSDLNLDLYKIITNTNQKLYFNDNRKNNLSDDDIIGFKKLIEQNSEVEPNKLITKTTNILSFIDILKNNEDPQHIAFFWDIFKPVIMKAYDKALVSNKKSNETDISKFEFILYKPELYKEIGVYNEYNISGEQEKLLNKFKTIILYATLTNKIEYNSSSIKKTKI